MTRSKLETYLHVLEVLVAKPLEFELVLYQVDEKWRVVKNHLDFLIANGLVEALPLGKKRVIYSITDRGLAVLDALRGQEYLQQHDHLLLAYEK
jgi:predicted transcriptional regulator